MTGNGAFSVRRLYQVHEMALVGSGLLPGNEQLAERDLAGALVDQLVLVDNLGAYLLLGRKTIVKARPCLVDNLLLVLLADEGYFWRGAHHHVDVLLVVQRALVGLAVRTGSGYVELELVLVQEDLLRRHPNRKVPLFK